MRNIYLLGFAGCGKSTLGKRIAAQLGYQFLDLDALFEQRYGDISDFFAKEGEMAFRRIETDLLHETATNINTLISTGGGTPCYGDNMKYINDNGFSVYLYLPAKVLADRLKNSHKQRPLLRGQCDLLQYIKQTLPIREMYYRQATLIVSVLDIHTDRVVEQIKQMIV